jgi:hypothetical protein
MTEPNTGASPATSPTPPSAQPSAPATGEEYKAMTPDAFATRLRSERDAGVKAMLSSLGIETPEALKSALTKAREVEQAQMTEAQRVQAKLAELEPKAKGYDEARTVLAETVSADLAALPANVRAFIESTTPDDPVARRRALNAARANGLMPTGANPAAPATPAAPPNPATTIAPAGPTTPKPAGTLTTYEQWNDLKQRGQSARAAQFYSANRKAIEATRPK